VGIGITAPSTKLHVSDSTAGYVSTIENLGTGTGKSGLWVKTDSTWTNALILKLTGSTSDTSIMEVNAATVRIGGGTITQNDQALHLPDNKKIGLGDSSDLQIYHDGSNSYISQTVTGNLVIQNTTAASDIVFKATNSSGVVNTMFTADGGILKTTFSRDTKHIDTVKALFGTNDDLQIYHDGSNSYIKEVGAGSLIYTRIG
jgi:hemin uptake protein HemP